ncbi:MAG: [Fe-Fe] hydrogenase large subunit C-terminal domain-containing protein [Oscillospiraceae bacterium]
MDTYFHSVELDQSLCKGCTNCVRRCPTEAIRVRNGKAFILKERCIDCGECIRICPHHAKKAIVSSFESFSKYKYLIALPAPALYAQFNNLQSPAPVISALKSFGFDEVYEVAYAAEVVTSATKQLMKAKTLKYPVISSACPAVLRLIRVRFPELIDNILPLKSPAQYAGLDAKRIAMEKTGLTKEEIGTVFISPCPAKVTSSKNPLTSSEQYIDEVVAIRDIYPKLLPLMQVKAETQKENESKAGRDGISWGKSGGESEALYNDKYLAADGIENVINVLESLEDDKLKNIDFVELNACSGGCVGGVLTVENPFVAKTRLKILSNKRPINCYNCASSYPTELNHDKKIEFLPVMQLDNDIKKASAKLKQIKEIEKRLCGLDCGSCGAPTCRALAEDIVRGYATEDYCVYRVNENVFKSNEQEYGDLNLLPPAFRTDTSTRKLTEEMFRNGVDKDDGK